MALDYLGAGSNATANIERIVDLARVLSSEVGRTEDRPVVFGVVLPTVGPCPEDGGVGPNDPLPGGYLYTEAVEADLSSQLSEVIEISSLLVMTESGDAGLVAGEWWQFPVSLSLKVGAGATTLWLVKCSLV